MLSMTHLLLLSVIIATMHLPVHAGETSSDYVYDDDDSSRPPGKIEKSTVAPLKPYFDEGNAVVYVNRSAEQVKLDCPVHHYDVVHHAIVWYRNDMVAVNGNQSIIKDFNVDNQLALTIPLENATSYNYSCQILPSNVRRNITLKFHDSNGAPSISWSTSLSVFALICQVTIRSF